jgi:ABC-type phosphate transport system substrate-binding protein
MPQGHRMRRARLSAVTGFIGASALIVGFAAPAGAASAPAANHMVIGGGSNTTYTMMSELSQLFNESPGCDLAVPSGTQGDNYACPNPQNVTGGENGLGDGKGYADNGSKQQGDPENPYNDVVVEEPALGSSNGIKELDQRGSNSAPLDFARSSRGPNNGLPAPVGDPVTTASTDPEGLNFVAYAADAVPWLHWTKFQNAKTPSSLITSLSIPQLAAVYNGTITTWKALCPTGSAAKKCDKAAGTKPIVVYTAQNGSGTEGTWASELGLTLNGNANLFNGVPNDGNHVIFENEIHGIIDDAAGDDAANAIFYFSYGKFQTDCVPETAAAHTATCGSDKSPAGSSFTLGQESIATGASGIAATPTTILNGSFPTDRFLYNVYSNGTNGSFPASSQAALNFASEFGFICKQDTATDSNTGATYSSEIQNIITSNGFFPLASGTIDGDATNIDSNAHITDPGYAFVDPLSQGSPTTAADACRLFTTDGDGTA